MKRFKASFLILFALAFTVGPLAPARAQSGYRFPGDVAATGTLTGTKGIRSSGYGSFGSWLQPGQYATSARPGLTTSQEGAQAWDNTLDSPIWWNGTEWKTSYDFLGLSLPFYDVRLFGLKADTRSQEGLSVNVGTSATTMTAATNAFEEAIVGKKIYLPGAGAGGAKYYGTITARASAQSVTISPAASTTVSNVSGRIGTDNRAALNTLANTTLASTGGTLVFSHGTFWIGSNVTVPNNCRVRFEADGALYHPENVATTLQNPVIEAPLVKIFDGDGTIHTPYPILHPEWLGAKGDGATDDRAAIQKTFEVCRRADQVPTAGTLAIDIGVSTTAVHASVASFTSAHDEAMIDIPGAGPGGSSLLTRIVTVVDNDDIVIANAASTSVSAAQGYTFRGRGVLQFAPNRVYAVGPPPSGVHPLGSGYTNTYIDDLTVEGNGAALYNIGGTSTGGATSYCTLTLLGNRLRLRNLKTTLLYTPDVHSTTLSTVPSGINGSGEANAIMVGGYGSTFGEVDDVLVENCTVTGAWYGGIRPIYASNVTIRRCTVTDAMATGIWPGDITDTVVIDKCIVKRTADDLLFVGRSAPRNATKNVWITNNTLYDSGARGAGVGGAHYVHILNNNVELTWVGGITINQDAFSTDGAKHVEIVGNYIRRAGKNFGASGYRHTSVSSVPHGIYASNGTATGFFADWRIEKNEIEDSQGAGILLTSVDGLTLDANKVKTSGGTGISVGLDSATDNLNVTNFAIRNNEVSGTPVNGIYVRHATKGEITNNRVWDYGTAGGANTDRGIVVIDSDQVPIKANTVTNTRDAEKWIESVNSGQSPQVGNLRDTEGYDNMPGGEYLLGSRVITWLASAPSTIGSGSWRRGDVVFNTVPAAGGLSGWICTGSGTYGTLAGVTATATMGAGTITVSSAAALVRGMYITVAGLTNSSGGGTATALIKSISGTTLTLSEGSNFGGAWTNSATIMVPAAVSWVTPTFETFGSVGTVQVENGGTEVTTLADRGVLVGRGTAPIEATAAGAAGTVLVGNGATTNPSFSASPSISGTLTVGQLIDSGLSANTLIGADGSKQLISATVTAPLSYSSGALSIPQANGSTDGFLDNVDWATFNSKLSAEADTLDSVTDRNAATPNTIEAGAFRVGSSGPTITKGTGAPSASDPTGSLYLNTSGAVGFNLYVRDSGPTWYPVLVGPPAVTVSLDYPSVAAQNHQDLTVTVTGATGNGETVHATTSGTPDAGLTFYAWVSAANTVTVRAINYTGSAVDPPSRQFVVRVIKG